MCIRDRAHNADLFTDPRHFVVSVKSGVIPILPIGPLHILNGGSVAGKENSPYIVAVLGDSLPQRQHSAWRSGKAVNHQNAVAAAALKGEGLRVRVL